MRSSVAQALDAELGDPFDPTSVLSFRRAVALDERDEYPEEAGRLLLRLGFLEYLIPAALGGRLDSFEDLLTMNRIVARRDLTVAIAHGQTFLGALPVWLSGTPEQKETMVELIREGGQAALALTEEGHGSDILANELFAEPLGTDKGYCLTGEKWLINNGTRGTLIVVHALTDPHRRSPRRYSLFLVDKRRLSAGSFSHVPRKRTLGIRGADISGIRLERAVVPSTAMLGEAGCGFDLTLRVLQVSRMLCAGFSLGAADTALRVTLRFAVERKLYGDTMLVLPETRRILVQSFLRLIECEQVAVAAIRGLHACPRQASIWSAVVKYFVPTTVEKLVHGLSVLLGARHYLREGHDFGIFQKLMRDNLVVGLFDGSTVVNLQAIGVQLRSLQTGQERDEGTTMRERLRNVFRLSSPLPAFDPKALELYNRGLDDVIQGMELARNELNEPDTQGAVAGIRDEIASLAAELSEQIKKHRRQVSEFGQRHDAPILFHLAAGYCRLFAAAACLHSWRENREEFDGFFAEGRWLVLCLEELLSEPGRRIKAFERHSDYVVRQLLSLHAQNRLFSLNSFALPTTQERHS